MDGSWTVTYGCALEYGLGFAGVILVFILAIVGVAAGTRLAEAPKISGKVLAGSGALLIAISLIWVLPEVARQRGWLNAILCVAAGFAVIWAIDHFVYAICPSCSHSHDHGDCSRPLHGFAGPLLIAIGIHSFLDGWALAASQEANEFVRAAFTFGVGLHKIPEGLALGALARAAMSSHWKSFAACMAAESLTLAGGAVGFGLAARLGEAWVGILLAAAAGTFIYLGYHAIEPELHRRFAR